MKFLLLLATLGCANLNQAAMYQEPKHICKPVVVFRGTDLPVCSDIRILGRIHAYGSTKWNMMRDIQQRVCDIGGQMLIRTTTDNGNAEGYAARCNLPFSLPSDHRTR